MRLKSGRPAVLAGRDDELALLAGGWTSRDVRVGCGSAVAGLAGVGKTTLPVQAGRAAMTTACPAGSALLAGSIFWLLPAAVL
jgi:hypothetical protein